MKSTLLLRTNLLLCAILTAGFAAMFLVNRSSTAGTFRDGIEHVSELTSESIHHQINAYFTKPVSISMTMANNSLLKRLLSMEEDRMDDGEYQLMLQHYLDAYREQYGYYSVFLVSARTNRFYRFSGLDREMTRGKPENEWYFRFLDSPEASAVNVAHDESRAAGRALTIFVNHKIDDGAGGVMGVVGVGLRVGSLRELLRSYRERYGIRAILIDGAGNAAVSSEPGDGDASGDMFDGFEYVSAANIGGVIADIGADGAGEGKAFWAGGRSGDCFVALRRVPAVNWRLVVESNTSVMAAEFRRQILFGAIVAAFIALAVLVVVNKVVMAYNEHLLERVVAKEMEYNALVKKAAGEMYRDIRDEKERATQLIQDSRTDPLTGLYNRRFMEKRLGEIMRRLSRSRGTLSILMIDVDFFKSFNDAYGHCAGDECLRNVAAVLRSMLRREGDFIARYGGEEFLAVLPDTDAKGARSVAEALLRGMIERGIPHRRNEAAGCVTLSIGGATGKVDRAHTMESCIARADAALYVSKADGRNRYTGGIWE